MTTILVVDDFASVRLFHANLVRAQKWECIAAKDAEEALRALEHTPVDAIVLDLLMPGIGGEEFLKRLRSKQAFESLPVVVITSEACSLCANDPATVVLSKPVLPHELVKALREGLAKGKPVS